MRLTAVCLLFFLAATAGCRSDGGDRARTPAGQAALAARSDPSGPPQAEAETVRFTTADGIVIVGSLYPAPGKGPAPVVLCLHQWRGSRADYAAVAAELQRAGYGVLAIDLRGNGASTRTSDGREVRPDRVAGADVEAALVYLRAHPRVDKARIAIMGASYGASNALIVAARDRGVKACVLLSPGVNYFNVLPTGDAMKAYAGRPLCVAVSTEDMRSMEAAEAYAAIDRDVTRITLDNAGHGTEMFGAGQALWGGLKAFLARNL